MDLALRLRGLFLMGFGTVDWRGTCLDDQAKGLWLIGFSVVG